MAVKTENSNVIPFPRTDRGSPNTQPLQSFDGLTMPSNPLLAGLVRRYPEVPREPSLVNPGWIEAAQNMAAAGDPRIVVTDPETALCPLDPKNPGPLYRAFPLKPSGGAA